MGVRSSWRPCYHAAEPPGSGGGGLWGPSTSVSGLAAFWSPPEVPFRPGLQFPFRHWSGSRLLGTAWFSQPSPWADPPPPCQLCWIPPAGSVVRMATVPPQRHGGRCRSQGPRHRPLAASLPVAREPHTWDLCGPPCAGPAPVLASQPLRSGPTGNGALGPLWEEALCLSRRSGREPIPAGPRFLSSGGVAQVTCRASRVSDSRQCGPGRGGGAEHWVLPGKQAGPTACSVPWVESEFGSCPSSRCAFHTRQPTSAPGTLGEPRNT